MEKNEHYIVTITDYSIDGEGIGKIGAFPLFIKDTCIGDQVECLVMKLKKNYGYARLLQVVTPSEARVEGACERARACGGCQIQQMAYEKQLLFKRGKVEDCMKRIGGIMTPVNAVLGMENPWNYRNKAQVPFGKDKENRVICGFYAGHTHDIIPMVDCKLTFPESKTLLEILLKWMKEFKVSAYEEETGRGILRHALLRKGYKTGELMVCLIINGKEIPAVEKLVELLQEVPGFKTLCLNENTDPGNVILGRKTKALYGPGYIEDYIGENKFRISPESFFQVNPIQTEKLYKTALEFADLSGQETIWDVYCGIGTISLFLAGKAKKVYGVEIVERAIEDAKRNAEVNGRTNTEFFMGKAEEVLPEWYGKNPSEQIDVIVVDPPRKGCDEACLETILKMQPEKVVYVSCDPATLARDLKILSQGGYEIKRIQPVDMFPQTVHVECVVLLSRL